MLVFFGLGGGVVVFRYLWLFVFRFFFRGFIRGFVFGVYLVEGFFRVFYVVCMV